jgi:hypothetical protein
MRIWANSLSFFGKEIQYAAQEIDWKALLITGLRIPESWLPLSEDLFTESEVTLLCNEFFEVLVSPMPPLIELKRESHVFETEFQDYLSKVERPEMDLEDDCMQPFETHLQQIYSEAAEDLDQLHSMRWNLPVYEKALGSGRNSLSTMDSDEDLPLDTATPNLLKMCQAVQATTKFWCEFSNVLLSSVTSEDDLITEYAKRWNAFSAAALDIDQKFSKFNAVFNEVYSAAAPDCPQYPKFSLLRLMAFEWRRSVLDCFLERLVEAGANVLKRYRESTDFNVKESALELLWRLSTSLLDLSVNELSVHFSQHSQFDEQGPYAALHDRLLHDSTEVFRRLDASAFGFEVCQELSHLSRCLLPCTIAEMSAKAKCYETSLLLSQCLQKCDVAYSEPFRQPDETVEYFLAKPVGVFLTLKRPIAAVKDLFRTCSIEQLQVLEGVDALLSGVREKSASDYNIERRAETIGLTLEDCSHIRFSLSRDLSRKALSEVFELEPVNTLFH